MFYFLTSSVLITVNCREDKRIAVEKNLTEYKDRQVKRKKHQ